MLPHEKITAAITAATDAGRVGLVPYVTAGYPDKDRFIETLREIETSFQFNDAIIRNLVVGKRSAVTVASPLARVEDEAEKPKAEESKDDTKDDSKDDSKQDDKADANADVKADVKADNDKEEAA